MINFIEISDTNTFIFEHGKCIEYNKREGIINVICKAHFIDAKKYMQYARAKLGITQNVPIYLSSSLLLFRIKADNKEYHINYFMIKYVEEMNGMIIIHFLDGSAVDIKTTQRKYEIIEKKINIILHYIDNLENEYF